MWLLSLPPIWPFPFFEWGYEELPRVVSPNGRFEIVSVRGNAGAVTGYTYDLFVVEKGGVVDREKDWTQKVFYAPKRTELLGYRWNAEVVEIEIVDGPVGFYHSFCGTRDGFKVRRVGRVDLVIRRKAEKGVKPCSRKTAQTFPNALIRRPTTGPVPLKPPHSSHTPVLPP